MSSFQFTFEWHERCKAKMKCHWLKGPITLILLQVKNILQLILLYLGNILQKTPDFRNVIEYICFRYYLSSVWKF